MQIHVSVPELHAQRLVSLFNAALPEATTRVVDYEGAGLVEPQAQYVVCACRDRTLFDRERAMKAIFALGAGVGHLLSLVNLPSHVPLIRLEDAGMASQMVRYTLAVTLRFAQRLDRYAAQQRERVWRQLEPRKPEMLEVGVLGLGVIGTAIAEALVGQGFRVRGYARTAKSLSGARCFNAERFDDFLTGLDVLINIVPLTDETQGILNRRTLSRLADGAHVINIARGGHLVEADLLALLESGKLSGATLDVFDDEPLPAEHPFWTHPAIAVTPHISGLTLLDEAVAQVAAKIRRLESGLPVTGIVDRARGY